MTFVYSGSASGDHHHQILVKLQMKGFQLEITGRLRNFLLEKRAALNFYKQKVATPGIRKNIKTSLPVNTASIVLEMEFVSATFARFFFLFWVIF